jgi:hypothetical protein
MQEEALRSMGRKLHKKGGRPMALIFPIINVILMVILVSTLVAIYLSVSKVKRNLSGINSAVENLDKSLSHIDSFLTKFGEKRGWL